MKYWISLLVLISSFNAQAMKAIDESAFPSKKFENREGPRTDSIIVWKDGSTLYERYDRGYTKEKKHILWSISKTITSLLIAVAEFKGIASRSDSICNFDKSIPKDKCKILLEDVIKWTTGLRWVEEYEKSNRLKSASVIAMLYGEGFKDMYRFVLGHEFETVPGQSWRYSSGDTVLMASLLRKIFKNNDIHKIFQKRLMGPLGIEDWTLEVDPKGNGIGASYFHMRPRDLLKIGQLIAGKGVFEGKRIYAADWYEFMSTPADIFKVRRFEHDNVNIGGGSIWLNLNEPVGMDDPPWPTAPMDTMMGMGHWGQYLMVVPSLNLVAVRTGDTRDGKYKAKDFAASVMRGIRE